MEFFKWPGGEGVADVGEVVGIRIWNLRPKAGNSERGVLDFTHISHKPSSLLKYHSQISCEVISIELSQRHSVS